MMTAIIVLSSALTLSVLAGAVVAIRYQKALLASSAMMCAHAENAMNAALSINSEWRDSRDTERKWDASERVAIERGRQEPKPPGFPDMPNQTDGVSSITDESVEEHRLVG